MATTIYHVSGDTGRSITVDLEVDGAGFDLTGYTVELHMTNLADATVTTVTDVTADADQTTYPGRCVTVLTDTELVTGSYLLEWEASTAGGDTVVTFPSDGDERNTLVVRAEAA